MFLELITVITNNQIALETVNHHHIVSKLVLRHLITDIYFNRTNSKLYDYESIILLCKYKAD